MHRPKGAFRLYSSDPAEIIRTDTESLYDSKRHGEPIQRISLTDIVSVEVEDGEAIQARVIATRLVTLGILAFAVDGLMRFVAHTRAAVKAAQSQPAPAAPAAPIHWLSVPQ